MATSVASVQASGVVVGSVGENSSSQVWLLIRCPHIQGEYLHILGLCLGFGAFVLLFHVD